MYPVSIQIELSAQFVDSEIQDMIFTRGYVLERDIKPRTYRKKYQQTLQQFLDSQVPGRHRQIQKISNFIQNLKSGQKSPLCLHGSTGCGKTSIITQLIHYLTKNNKQFKTMYINCLNFTNIKRIYSTILQNLFQRKDKKPEQALSYIFSKQKQQKMSQIKLIVFDEIDQCFNNKAFIYNILEWVQISQFPFGVILISNMIDFTANLQHKSKSRIKFNSIIFAPYHYQQLIDIVKHKYKQSKYKFQQDAIIYLCKKIASINSDVRLLQKYYIDALRKFQKSNNYKININQIQTLFVSQENQIKQIIKPYQFILQILWRSPRGKDIQIDIQHYCLANGIKKYSQGEIIYMLTALQDMRIIKLRRDRKPCNFYYCLWGIDLEQYAYTLQATRLHN